MAIARADTGGDELRRARADARWLFRAVALFSLFVNVLMLTGPLFMLQVYDRVLGSRSEETLTALVVLMTFLFATMGVLDFVRGRVLARIGAGLSARLGGRVFSAVLRKAALSPRPEAVPNALGDLASVQRFIASPAFAALYDIPFTPLFLAGIAVFHPLLGLLALAGGALLVLVSVLNQIATRAPSAAAAQAGLLAERRAFELRAEAEMVRALGMEDAAFARWQRAAQVAQDENLTAQDRAGRFTALTRTFRLFLQSAMLGLGAWLVLRGEVTAGAMIAGSILLGRALAPVELLIGQWTLVQRAREGRAALRALLREVPPEPARTALPRPAAHLRAENLTIVPPGQAQASIRMLNFEVKPGQALGVIGPSGAGKSSVARAITGVWRPAGGKIRLDDAALDQFEPAVLGRHIGYLPQRVQMFDGTIAENIAGLAEHPDDAAVVKAAQAADAHQMILRLPDGYDTMLSSGGGLLSGGQLQRIGLARAHYGDPVLLVLDEPNSSLDNDGAEALNRAVVAMKAAGGAVLIMAHRPSAIRECDLLMVLDGGNMRAFGPRDQVLAKTVGNARQIQAAQGGGGVT